MYITSGLNIYLVYGNWKVLHSHELQIMFARMCRSRIWTIIRANADVIVELLGIGHITEISTTRDVDVGTSTSSTGLVD